MADFLAGLRARGDGEAPGPPPMSFADFNDLIGTTEQVALAERYRE
jgi:hypothetical protein